MKKLGFLLIVALLLGNSCREKEDPLVVETAFFILINKSNENTHMWLSGDVMRPDNQIAPGTKRIVEYTKNNLTLSDVYPPLEEQVIVYAGRNGQVLATKTCYLDSQTLNVSNVFDGTSIN